jgi:hypothetical protein
MDPRQALISLMLLGLAFPHFVLAQVPAPGAPLSATAKSEVIETLGRKLKSIYVFPDVADRVSAGLAERSANDGYATAGTATAFAKALADDLRKLGNDRHLGVLFDPDLVVHAEARSARSPAEVAIERDEMLRDGFGVARVERLPGNVGYLDVRGFGPAEFVGDAYGAALSLLAGTDALILDLRRNGGGEPGSVAYLMSHFFAEGDARHLNDIYYREGDETRQFWTSASVKSRYTKPVYVLISGFTFSGGEECAYDFQTQKRGTLVGETTGGGANPGAFVALGHGLVAFIPNGRAINPVTKTNWEHVGVKPDVTVAAAQAEQTAYAQILRSLIAKATDPETRDDLRTILTRVEKGESEKVSYAPPH